MHPRIRQWTYASASFSGAVATKRGHGETIFAVFSTDHHYDERMPDFFAYTAIPPRIYCGVQ